MDDPALAWVSTGVGAVVDLAFALAVGALLAAAITPRTLSAWRSRRVAGALRLLGMSALVALAASLVELWLRTQLISGAAPLGAVVEAWSVARDTAFGRAWATGCAALALLALSQPGLRRGQRDLALIACIAIVVDALARAGAGHAGARGFGPATAVMAVHLLATASWAGLVFVAALSTLADADPRAGAERAAWVARLSAGATISIALAALTGLAIAWPESDGFARPLRATPWGMAFAIKLALAGLALGLGGWNRFVNLPPLLLTLRAGGSGDIEQRRFRRILRVEAAVLGAVIVCARVLGDSAPPVG